MGERPRPFPTLDRAFDAVERALAQLGVEDPASLRSPRPVEEVLSHSALPPGTLLVLSPSELRAAEEDVIDTMKDERTGGSSFLAIPDRLELIERRGALRELALVAPTFLFAGEGPLPAGLTRMRRVVLPAELKGYRFVVADSPGFRVAVVARTLPGGGFVALWSGEPSVVEEVTQVLRAEALGAGHQVPAPAAPVPPLEGIASEADVWRQAADLRAYRVVREAQLRDIARAAALKGVAMRRARESA
jgi:hypothetical protein